MINSKQEINTAIQIQHLQKNIEILKLENEELAGKLTHMIDIASALVITDIRNRNLTAEETQKDVKISYQFLTEISEKCKIHIAYGDNTIVITPTISKDVVED